MVLRVVVCRNGDEQDLPLVSVEQATFLQVAVAPPHRVLNGDV
jgi:hypothetical protein